MLQKENPVELYDNAVVATGENSKGNGFTKIYSVKARPKKCIGFDGYAEQVFDSLLKRNGSTLVTGQRGVGKTALVQHVQHMIDEKLCPSKFYNVEIRKADLLTLSKNIKSLAEYEERLDGLFGEMLANGKTIAYIDNLYQFTVDNHVNVTASLFIESYIKRGLTFIACCSDEDLKNMDSKYLLLRHFTEVKIKEPGTDETAKILEAGKDEFFEKYRVEIDSGICEKVTGLCEKYIKGSLFRMPKKAYNALEHIATHHINKFYGLDGKTKKKIEKLQKANKEIDDILMSDEPDYGRLVELEVQCDELNQSIELDKKVALPAKIDDSCVYDVISNLAKVPVAKLTESDTEKLRNMEDALQKVVIGQNETISKVCKTIKRNRLGIRKSNHTIGNFMFVGPTGVGKTMLAKELTKYMFGNYESIIRLDMSEYIDEISVNKLIGAPPGYVGYGDGGVLCNAIKKNPYSVVLFDEIEKAHPSVFNTLLQLLDEGHITDSNGNKISAMNCIVVMTSNIGVKEAGCSRLVGFAANQEDEENKKAENTRSIIDKTIKRDFSPEFINRLDGICYFNDLKKETINKIFDNEMAEVCKELKKIGHTISVSKSAKKYIVEKSEKEHMGARPLIRIIQQEVVDEITDMIINGDETEKINVTYDKKNNKLKLG